jgi:hypothetical protein
MRYNVNLSDSQPLESYSDSGNAMLYSRYQKMFKESLSCLYLGYT